MKRLLLCSILLSGASLAAQAQLLPVPNARNPDWILENTQPGSRPSRPDSLGGSRDRMPIADPNRRAPAAKMPNALPKSLSSIGDTRHYWDADRQLAYEWKARPGSTAPDQVVIVRQQATGALYTYRRRPQMAEARKL